MRPSQISQALNACVERHRPAFVWGPPGVGKSDVVAQLAKSRDCQLRDARLGTMDPTDIKGFPVPNVEHGHMEWLPPDFLPPMLVKKEVKLTAKKTEVQTVANDSRGILFLDELNQAPAMVQAASYQLLLNRRVGSYILPHGWDLLAAGNRETDRANAQRMPSALALRLVHLDYEVNLDDWVNWALMQGDRVPPELISFLRSHPKLFHEFDAAKRSSPNPRGWVFCGELTHTGLDPTIEYGLFSGAVGEGPAGEYRAHLQVHDQIPSVDQIKLDPLSTPVPDNLAARHAVTTMLAYHSDKNIFPRFMEYMKRMDPEWLITYVRDAQKRTNRAICDTKEYQEFGIKHSHLLA